MDDQVIPTVDAAERLVAALKAAKNFPEAKIALVEFITMMDTRAHVLGDADLAALAADSIRRRHKPLSDFEALAHATEWHD